MRFESDLILWLLLVLPPALVAFLWWAWRQRERLLGQFIEPRLLAGLTAGVSARRRKWKLGLIVASVALLLVAVARPQWGFHWEETKQRGLEIVVAIDTSKSMLADDITPNRLTRAKLAALDLMQQAKSDRLGLVAFAGSAFLMCPLTIDEDAFRQCVDALDVETIPQGGTALAEAIDTARTAFKEGAESYKVLILFTDGEDHDERAVEAATEAAKAGLRIFTIGIGTADGEMVRLKDAKGRTDFVRDDDGNVVKSKLNEPLLQEIAKAGNGFYLPLRGAKTMDTLYEQGLAPLPKSESQARLVKRFHERYHFPLALAIALLVIEFLVSERRRSAPPAARVTAPAARAATSLALLVCLLSAAPASASVATALRAYNAGRYDEAMREYEKLAEQKPDDLRLLFNAGDAAYRGTNFAAAKAHFTTVLTARDLKLQQAAYYNLGNTQYRLGELAEDLDAMQTQWEEAIKSFQIAVQLDKSDANAAHNLALVQKGIEQIKLLRELARQAREAAGDAVRQRNYHRALEIMQQIVQQNPFAKPFQDFTKKLENIDAIANPDSR